MPDRAPAYMSQETDEGKLSRPVLRGLSGREAAQLPGEAGCQLPGHVFYRQTTNVLCLRYRNDNY
jgi:hypothetical protein